jgi:hypothetical protein
MTDGPTKKDAGSPKSWKDIAEVRMIMYVVPAGLIMALIGYVLSTLSH